MSLIELLLRLRHVERCSEETSGSLAIWPTLGLVFPQIGSLFADQHKWEHRSFEAVSELQGCFGISSLCSRIPMYFLLWMLLPRCDPMSISTSLWRSLLPCRSDWNNCFRLRTYPCRSRFKEAISSASVVSDTIVWIPLGAGYFIPQFVMDT